MAKTLIAAVTLILLLAACAPSAPVTRPDPVETDRARIEAMMADGELADAARAWLELADQYPDQATDYRLNALELWLADGSLERAAALIEALDAARLNRDQRHRLDLGRAELALLTGDLSTASWLLASLAETLPVALATRHALLEARLRTQLERPTRAAFEAMEEAIENGDFEPELALALLIEQPLVELEQLLLDHGHRADMLPWLELVVTSRRYLLDPSQLDQALHAWAGRHPMADFDAEQALLWLTAWRQTRPVPARVAVLLPGRAPMSRVSAALRDGLMSAWTGLAPGQRPELLFRYIEDDPQAAIAAWFELREAGIDFVIGPLERGQVDTLMALPDPGLPMLLLNHPSERVEDPERFGTVQTIGLLPEEEAELAAVQALVQGHRRVLVIAQNSDWGRRVASAFVDTFELGGGQVLANADYSTDQVDHSAMLEVVLQLDRSGQRAVRLSRVLGQDIESEPHRRTDADLLFLAARAEDGLQIRPQLRFFGAGDMPTLATSQIIAGAPDARRDEDLDGILVPLSPWFIDTSPAGEQRRRAERLYPELGNPTLSRLHALGFDALSLVPWLDLMRRDPDLYMAGLSGRLRLPGGPYVERDLPFVRLVNGRAVPLQ